MCLLHLYHVISHGARELHVSQQPAVVARAEGDLYLPLPVADHHELRQRHVRRHLHAAEPVMPLVSAQYLRFLSMYLINSKITKCSINCLQCLWQPALGIFDMLGYNSFETKYLVMYKRILEYKVKVCIMSGRRLK